MALKMSGFRVEGYFYWQLYNVTHFLSSIKCLVWKHFTW